MRDAGKVVSNVPTYMQDSGTVAKRLLLARDKPVNAEVATIRELPDSISA
tara:strand:- start:531 stop:680 length:150 start_codon:yes stop_codon:yes gene_type:complete